MWGDARSCGALQGGGEGGGEGMPRRGPPQRAGRAPPRPAARVEPGRLSQAPAPNWAGSGETSTAWRKSVEKVLNASPSRHSSLYSDDVQPRRERCPERTARGVAEQQGESRSASALLGAEIHA